MSARDKLKEVAAFLKSHRIEDPAKEAEILITETLHIGKSELYGGDLEISDKVSIEIDSLAARRANGEPLQYITGHVEFYGLRINVGKGVLIPRPETELLVEKAKKEIKRLRGSEDKKDRIAQPLNLLSSQPRILDLCTGSGCIALAVAKHSPDAVVYGTDKSETAIEYAVRNAEESKVRNAHFKKGDLFQPVSGMKFDLVVSNPPYVKKEEIETLQREIKDYEPVEALDGGPDGLDFYRRIFREAPEYLKADGLLVLEIGYDQAEDIEKMAEGAGFRDICFMKDYSGIKRIFTCRK